MSEIDENEAFKSVLTLKDHILNIVYRDCQRRTSSITANALVNWLE